MSVRAAPLLMMLIGHLGSCASPSESDAVVRAEALADARSSFAEVEQEFEGANSIVHPALWEALRRDDDPVAAKELDVASQCGDEALSIEVTEDGLYLDLDTTECDWLTLEQASTRPLFKGDTLRVWAFRWPMVVAQGEGLLKVAAGNPPITLWEHRPLLPQERSELYYEEVQVSANLPAGTPIYWHVANHGQNVWSLIALLRLD